MHYSSINKFYKFVKNKKIRQKKKFHIRNQLKMKISVKKYLRQPLSAISQCDAAPSNVIDLLLYPTRASGSTRVSR